MERYFYKDQNNDRLKLVENWKNKTVTKNSIIETKTMEMNTK